MKQIKSMICMWIALCLTVSCSDFLEEKSKDEVIPSTVDDYREILLAYQTGSLSPALLTLDDDVKVDESRFSTTPHPVVVSLVATFTYQPDIWEQANSQQSYYKEIYENIMAMNVILEKIDDAKGDMAEKEMVTAQALGVRACYYFILVNMYGAPYNYNKEALGVVLKLRSSYADAGMSRATVAEVYEQIVEDLETASVLLNKYPKSRGDFLINSTAVDILLSRVYLYMEEWDKAVVAANRAIETAEGLFDYTTLPIGQHFYMPSYDNPEVEWLFSNFTLPTFIIASNDLVAGFGENDRRLEFLCRSFSGPGKLSTNGFTPNVTVRSAEAYLNRAEALVLSEIPDLSGALADLNELRRHRITGYTDVNIADTEVLLEEIRKERRLELCHEGHRWFDLRRYGMPSISHDFRTNLVDPLLRYTLEEKDDFYTLPLPQVALESNVMLEQNPSAFKPEREGIRVN